MALVMGLGGMRRDGKSLSFAPRLPQQITRLAFRFLFRGCCLHIEVKATEAAYHLLNGAPLTVKHYGDEITLPVGKTVTCPIDAREAGPRPTQPTGRTPITREARRSAS